MRENSFNPVTSTDIAKRIVINDHTQPSNAGEKIVAVAAEAYKKFGSPHQETMVVSLDQGDNWARHF